MNEPTAPNTDVFTDIIEKEENRLQRSLREMRAALAQQEEARRAIEDEARDLKRQQLEAVGWAEKREVGERIASCRERLAMHRDQDPGALRQPYFGVLELDDDALGPVECCLGHQTFFNASGKALVIDWREAPVSRLYYEYEAGELFEETIRGRDRSGVVRTKRQVDTSGGELRKILDRGVPLTRDASGAWHHADDPARVLSRKEEVADHRLPEITALIDRSQFRAITRPEASTVVLQGGAGSGKTTVGLHRIAYLCYQDPQRFRPGRILVVMFNRSLQHYISRVLPDLGIAAGVHVETYHGWAGKLFRAAGVSVAYSSSGKCPEAVTRLKKHAVMLALVDRYLETLLEKSRSWLLDSLVRLVDPQIDSIAALMNSAARLEDLVRILTSSPLFNAAPLPEGRKRLKGRLLQRLNDHQADFFAALSDRALLEEVAASRSPALETATLEALSALQAQRRQSRSLDFADTGILLRLMQRKGIAGSRPDYAHIMVDEAQDLGEVELATLLHAADSGRSITICGDMAQKIKGDVAFGTGDGFAGFVRRHGETSGLEEFSAETLVVGYRATRPIMELAWAVLGVKAPMTVPREGSPVLIQRTSAHEETMREAKRILAEYGSTRPKALVAVVCRYKSDADRVFEDLKALGLERLRRHERDDFSFAPGIIVTNAHQVKGLEFTAVLVINPASTQYRDDHESRMLLHVALTRAADHLWILGHEPMAFGLDKGWEGVSS